jgi:hypothetical protein
MTRDEDSQPIFLTVGIEVWVTNVLAFSIVYWDLDRGSPENRASESDAAPDWLFPQAGLSNEAARGWRPGYVEYLFLAVSDAASVALNAVAVD